MKMLIEMWMDGYENEEEMCKACVEYVPEQLDATAISCTVLWAETPKSEDISKITSKIYNK